MTTRNRSGAVAPMPRRAMLTAAAGVGAATLLGARPAAASGLTEARDLLTTMARESGRPGYSPRTAVRFDPNDNVFLKSVLSIDFTRGRASATLPLFEGRSPRNEPVQYIITEASDFAVAAELGVNYAPKLRYAARSPGAMQATVTGGHLQFRGNVDFSPAYEVAPGAPYPFPPRVAKPGAIADAEYSSVAVLPSGVVLNAQIVSNASGDHDRLLAKDLQRRTVTLSILDGFAQGRQFFYHLVTDVSADVPAVLEKGVYAPRLANLPTFGQSRVDQRSALLGFSPVLNGIVDPATGQNQGFATSLANGGIDPINIFPFGPTNEDSEPANNYSPLWDAHVSMWTDAAMRDGRVRRITSFDDLRALVEAGDVTSAMINPEGPGNPYLFGLRPTRAIINCPVIAHPGTAR